jgi:hypothetical protein
MLIFRGSDDNSDVRFIAIGTGLLIAAAASGDQRSNFKVDGVASAPSVFVATIQPRADAPEYSWLRIYFYGSLSAAERAQAERGGMYAQRTHWAAVLQVSLDRHSTIWQVDVAVPGHSCTVAASDREAKSVVQAFRYEGGRLSLQTAGSHVCDFSAIHVPNQRFEWDVSVDAPVFQSR